MVTPPGNACAAAFKEWAGVCDALLQGRQSIIVRKGGIREAAGPGAFVPEHSEFWLYPTWTHQAEGALRMRAIETSATAPRDSVPIRALVRVDYVGYVQSEEALPALDEFHIYTRETMVKRFHYRRPGLWVIGARTYRRDPEVRVAVTPFHAGCKTWVMLEEPLFTGGLRPVCDDAQWAARREQLKWALSALV